MNYISNYSVLKFKRKHEFDNKQNGVLRVALDLRSQNVCCMRQGSTQRPCLREVDSPSQSRCHRGGIDTIILLGFYHDIFLRGYINFCSVFFLQTDSSNAQKLVYSSRQTISDHYNLADHLLAYAVQSQLSRNAIAAFQFVNFCSPHK